MSGINKTGMPEWCNVARLVSIEGIDAVMLCCYENHIMATSSDGHIGHKERLRIEIAIDGVRHTFAKQGYIDVTCSEDGLIGILPGTKCVSLVGCDCGIAQIVLRR